MYIRLYKQRIAIAIAAVLVFLGCRPVWGNQARPALIQPVLEQGELKDGDFESSASLESWDIWFSETGTGGRKATYGISQEPDNEANPTKKLSLHNNVGRAVDFSVSQEVYRMKAGTYTAAILLEGDSDDRNSGSVFRVNGRQQALGKLMGWKNWKQVVIPGIEVQEGETVRVEIAGTLSYGQWMDIDEIQLIPSEEFMASDASVKEKVKERIKEKQAVELTEEAMPYEVSTQILNGNFAEELRWNVKNHPEGYLYGWTLPETGSEDWLYDVEEGKFQIINIDDDDGLKEFEIKQKVQLKAGSYQIDAVIGGIWDDSSYNEVCIRVAKPDGTLIGERYWATGYGQSVSDEFVVKHSMEVTVSFTFSLSGGRMATLSNVAVYPYPAKIKLHSVTQVAGKAGKEDTEKLRVKFARPVFDLGKENFSMEGALITDMENEGNGSYLLTIEELRAADGQKVTVSVSNPEGTVISPRKKTVKIYRDYEMVPGYLVNGDFLSGIVWDNEAYPDGYLDGWLLPKIDWDTWRFAVSADVFSLNNISVAEQRQNFKMHQSIRLKPGTYYLKADSPGNLEEEKESQIIIKAKGGGKVLADADMASGYGVVHTQEFILEKETTVDISVEFMVVGGKGAMLDYLILMEGETPDEPDKPEEPELPADVSNGDFSIGIDWAKPGYPDGYLEGWDLSVTDWDLWRYNTDSGNFELTNIHGDKTGSYFISQRLRLEPGDYRVNAVSPYVLDDQNPDGISIEIKGENGILAAHQTTPGCGDINGAEFTLSETTQVTLKIQFKLPPGGCAAIDDIRIEAVTQEEKNPVNWEAAVESGGESGIRDSEAVLVTFDTHMENLTKGQFILTGADATELVKTGDGQYTLKLSDIQVKDGEEISIQIKNPSGYEITPSKRTVVVYRKAAPSFTNPVVNGDFAQVLTYGPTNLPGWMIPADDWAVWSPYTVNGKFGVKNVLEDGDTAVRQYEITQEITLQPGTYQIRASLPESWISADGGKAKVTLSAGSYAVVESEELSGWPGEKDLLSGTFTIQGETVVLVTVRFEIPSGKSGDPSYVQIDNIEIIEAVD